METILITGGAGYIGGITARRLIEKGHKVIIFDNLSRGFKETISKYATFIQGDIGNKTQLRAILKQYKVDAVMHFASFTYVGESVKDPQIYFDNNIKKAINFLEILNEFNIKNIIFSSSASVYGTPKENPITEESEKNPMSAYGVTKYFFEQILESYRVAYGFNYVCLRYFNAAGAAYGVGEMHDPETHLIPLILQVANGQRENISIFGTDYPTADGTCIRDYIHIIDLADAHILSLRYIERKKSGCFNLGSGKGNSVREIIELCKEITGEEISVLETKRREGDPAVLVASFSKIKRELGWYPKYSINEIIESAWKWHNKKIKN
jgi:UDP-glucose 4-epimerase